MSNIQPELWLDRAGAAVAFYEAAFGAVLLHRVGEGDDIVAQLSIGGAAFWVASASPDRKRFSPQAIGGATSRTLLVVDDPDTVFEQAVAAGATPIAQVTDEHGWRVGRIIDPFGHEWEIGKPGVERVAGNSLRHVFGTSAAAVGEALRGYTQYRLRNVERIIERAVAKSHSVAEGRAVNLRVAHVLLADGSYCDDELMADYLGGLLAGSRTPEGSDDRAAAWSKVVTSLSSLQIKAHYLLYREWAARLRIVAVYDLGVAAGRAQATMEISSTEFARLLVADSEVDENDAMSHAVGGLIRAGLLADNFFYNGKLARVTPSIMGIELYGWAQGLAGLSPRSFASRAQPFDLEHAIARVSAVTFPNLPEHADVEAHPDRRQIQVQRQRHGATKRGMTDSEPG